MDHQDHRSFAHRVIHEIIRFNFVGALNTAITYGVYAGLVFLGTNHLLALLADYAFGITFSFFMNKHFTFRVHERGGRPMFLRMLLTYSVMLCVNLGGLWLLVDVWSWNKYLGQAVMLAFVAGAAFLAQRMFVFRLGWRRSHGE
jgi:putative flippase GtrA